MTFRVLFLGLCRRELGRRPAFVIAGWLLLGAGAAVTYAQLSAGQTGNVVVRMLGNFIDRAMTVLAFSAALLLIVRVAEDRERGWLLGWCGSHGMRAGYVLGVYLSTVATVAAVFTAAAAGFASTRLALGSSAEFVRLPLSLLVGLLVIGGVSAYGLLLGIMIQRVFPTVLLAVVLFVAPVIGAAVIVITQELPAVPDGMRLWVQHIPSPVPLTTTRGVLRQIAYIGVAVAASAWLARYRVARLT